uniref:receptor protein serine/threonine kinase n=1 Tax=Taeniopygia guttata TaxID=59729 RepID=A0A674HAY0_TAEGU
MGHPGPHNLTCVSYKHPSVRGALGGAGGTAAGAVRCPPGQCCVGIWNRSHALVQGCWGGRGDACPSATCAPSPAGHPGSSVLLCLCHGHLCNGNATGTGTAGGPGGPRQGPVPGQGGSAGTLWLLGAAPLLLILLVCLGGLGLRWTRARPGQLPRGGRRIGVPPEPPSPDLPALHFLQVLQTGRFSAVWRGSLRRRPVAIKAFAAGAGRRFRAERAVHALPLMEHQNVARLLHSRTGGPRGRAGLLVLQLYPAGSLRHFLGQHVGTWAGSVRLALSLARGLAFLHQELWRDGLYKPSVVHRDLSSQNVLVRDDGTCAIGDFGLALALPPRAQDSSDSRHAVAIRKAGTQRYLAPEILDESLDLRAWGRALRQADVYALALLLWEILSRCQALSPGEPRCPRCPRAAPAAPGAPRCPRPAEPPVPRRSPGEPRCPRCPRCPRPAAPPVPPRCPRPAEPPVPRRSPGAAVPAGLRGRAGLQPQRGAAPPLGRPREAAAADPPGLAPRPPARGGPAGAAGGLLGPRPRGAALGRAGAAAAPAPGGGTGPGTGTGTGTGTGPGGARPGDSPPRGAWGN